MWDWWISPSESSWNWHKINFCHGSDNDFTCLIHVDFSSSKGRFWTTLTMITSFFVCVCVYMAVMKVPVAETGLEFSAQVKFNYINIGWYFFYVYVITNLFLNDLFMKWEKVWMLLNWIKLFANRWAWELVPYRSAGGLSTSGTARRYPRQPCEREPPLHATAAWHRHTDKEFSGNIPTLPHTYLNL